MKRTKKPSTPIKQPTRDPRELTRAQLETFVSGGGNNETHTATPT